MAQVAATGVTNLGSLEGAVIGQFTVPATRAAGDTITVADTGIGANSQIIALIPQGVGGLSAAAGLFAVTAITAGTGFTLTYQGTASLTANMVVTYVRTA